MVRMPNLTRYLYFNDILITMYLMFKTLCCYYMLIKMYLDYHVFQFSVDLLIKKKFTDL